MIAATPDVQRTTDNAVPPCPHFGPCGGCQLQHLAYPAQLDRKAARLRELLTAFPLTELQLHASPPLGYRNRIRLTLREVDGKLRAGYLGAPGGSSSERGDMSGEHARPNISAPQSVREADAWDGTTPAQDRLNLGPRALLEPRTLNFESATFVPITQCPIAAPLLWRAAEAFLALANQAPWLRAPSLTPDQLELFTTADEAKLQLTLFLRTAAKNPAAKLATDFAALCQSLQTQIPELAGAGIAFLPAAVRNRQSAQPRPGPAWGAPGLNYTVEPGTSPLEPLTYWVPRGAFFQINRFLLPQLVSLVAHCAGGVSDRELVWDLYAGIGLFAKALFSPAHARSSRQVTAVEIAEPAATALAQTKLPNLRAVKATTLDFLRAAVLQRERPSLIILDPPRAGLGDEVCLLLTRIAARRLICVSCSPHALARDLAMLTASGYSITQLHLFDLFPQTDHIETVAVLDRA